ncbi:MAG: hypothetical protein QXV69_07195 [Sulfolobaceae archaeon]
MVIFYLISIMIAIHFLSSMISFSGKTFPKEIGNFIALYEIIFYVILTLFYLNAVSLILAIITYIYLLIHVVGGVLYIKGDLSKIYSSPKRLIYYGAYEFVELLYLIIILINFLK